MPFAIVVNDWEEDGFKFKLEDRLDGCWRWTHDPKTGSIPGFSLDLTTSASGLWEFEKYHKYFWTDKSSNLLKRGVIIMRKTSEGVLMLHSCTLRRSHPSLPTGHEVLRTLTSMEEWFAVVEETFFFQLRSLSDVDRQCLWRRVSVDHQAWLERRSKRGLTS
eukprot:gnl/MRDRNA2_/MRDRNA2_57591_c0_seq2.p1 gnl/MRDRNA2_/MRDRNA2_57591_c0~~gnl/MRDRNA2_/MRDRNA2_57591_c0_seq2.p1  ORF type:complete len:170 (-),score=23.66 gnl/MRDRNA2_/MRDRNA2_57591_c0_seq2:33-518(-)